MNNFEQKNQYFDKIYLQFLKNSKINEDIIKSLQNQIKIMTNNDNQQINTDKTGEINNTSINKKLNSKQINPNTKQINSREFNINVSGDRDEQIEDIKNDKQIINEYSKEFESNMIKLPQENKINRQSFSDKIFFPNEISVELNHIDIENFKNQKSTEFHIRNNNKSQETPKYFNSINFDNIIEINDKIENVQTQFNAIYEQINSNKVYRLINTDKMNNNNLNQSQYSNKQVSSKIKPIQKIDTQDHEQLTPSLNRNRSIQNEILTSNLNNGSHDIVLSTTIELIHDNKLTPDKIPVKKLSSEFGQLCPVVQQNSINITNSNKNLANFEKKPSEIIESQNVRSSRRNSTLNNLGDTLKMTKVQAYKSQLIDDMFQGKDEVEDIKAQLNISTMGAILLDKNHKILYVNNHITDTLLYDRKKLLDIDVQSLFPQSESLQVKMCLNTISDDGLLQKPFLINFQDSNLSLITLQVSVSKQFLNKIPIQVLWIVKPDEDFNQVINPKSIAQICQISFIVILLLFLMWQLPYDMVFGNNQMISVIEIPLTILFGFDILINFLVAYDDNGKLQSHHQEIAMHQMKGWLIVDIISTLPTHFIQQRIQKQNWLSSFKIMRVLRFFKLLRLLRLTKIYQIIKFISDSYIYRIYKFIKLNQGQLDLLKNMIQIQIFAHFWTIVFQAIELELCDVVDNCYLSYYQETKETAIPISDQHFLLQEHIKVALGLGAMPTFNNIEIYIATFWMFVGLSLFGYGIGNISSYLNQANKQDLEQAETMNYFNELCIMNNIDPRLQTIVLNNIEQNFSKQMDKELANQKDALSAHVFDQLESSLLEQFVSTFPVLEKLHVKSLRIIKHFLLQESNKFLLRKGMPFKDVQFVIKGTINIYDDKMEIVNFFQSNEIYGLAEFFVQFAQKQQVNIEKIFRQYTEQKDQQIKNLVGSKIAGKLGNILAGKLGGKLALTTPEPPKIDKRSLIKRLIDKFMENKIEYRQTISISDDFLTQNFNAICSDDVNYMRIPFHVFEEILFTDEDSFHFIYKQDMAQNRLLSDQEKKQSEELVRKFNNDERPGIIVLNDGQILDINNSFKNMYNQFQDGMKHESIFHIIYNNNFESIISKISEYSTEAEQKFNYNFIYDIVRLNIEGPHKILRTNNNNSIEKQAKSLVSSQFFQLDIITDD